MAVLVGHAADPSLSGRDHLALRRFEDVRCDFAHLELTVRVTVGHAEDDRIYLTLDCLVDDGVTGVAGL